MSGAMKGDPCLLLTGRIRTYFSRKKKLNIDIWKKDICTILGERI